VDVQVDLVATITLDLLLQMLNSLAFFSIQPK